MSEREVLKQRQKERDDDREELRKTAYVGTWESGRGKRERESSEAAGDGSPKA